jgi:hypothetical protein
MQTTYLLQSYGSTYYLLFTQLNRTVACLRFSTGFFIQSHKNFFANCLVSQFILKLNIQYQIITTYTIALQFLIAFTESS